jgi:hypothetical protein
VAMCDEMGNRETGESRIAFDQQKELSDETVY